MDPKFLEWYRNREKWFFAIDADIAYIVYFAWLAGRTLERQRISDDFAEFGFSYANTMSEREESTARGVVKEVLSDG